MKVLIVCVLALVAISVAEDAKKDKRSLNEIGFQPISEEQAALDRAALGQYAQALTGAQVFEPAQAEYQPIAENQAVYDSAALDQYSETLSGAQLIEPAIQQPIPIQQEAIQYAPQPLLYPTEPIVPQSIQYAPEAAPLPTVEKTVYKTTHVQHLVPQPYPVEKIVERIVDRPVPQPYPVEIIKHFPQPVLVDRPVPQPYAVKVVVPKPYPVYLKRYPSTRTLFVQSNLAGNRNPSNLLSNLLGRSNGRPAYSSLLQSLFSLNGSTNPQYQTGTSSEELVAIGNALGIPADGYIVRRIKQIKE